MFVLQKKSPNLEKSYFKKFAILNFSDTELQKESLRRKIPADIFVEFLIEFKTFHF